MNMQKERGSKMEGAENNNNWGEEILGSIAGGNMGSRCPLKFNFKGSVEDSKLLRDLVSMVGRLDLPDMVVNGERVNYRELVIRLSNAKGCGGGGGGVFTKRTTTYNEVIPLNGG
ncbi:hypothetical protein OROMI_014370 [Orobanche minor]